MDNTVEIDLPETSVIRKLFESRIVENENPENGIKEVESTLNDEEYNDMLKEFLEKLRKNEELNKPENRLRKKIMEKENERQKIAFRK